MRLLRARSGIESLYCDTLPRVTRARTAPADCPWDQSVWRDARGGRPSSPEATKAIDSQAVTTGACALHVGTRQPTPRIESWVKLSARHRQLGLGHCPRRGH